MTEVMIRPLRFTADVEAMRVFLETLGLRPRIEGKRGGWVDLVAGVGMVALHDAATSSTGGKSGDTSLSFEAGDIDRLKDQLVAAGHKEATTWDEAYGRVLSVTGPGGVEIWVDERSDDLYGYTLHQTAPDPRLTVIPQLTGALQADWTVFLQLLGSPQVTYGPPAEEFAVRLDLHTTEPLADVLDRLQAAGYAAELTGATITITDPDGRPVRVHA